MKIGTTWLYSVPDTFCDPYHIQVREGVSSELSPTTTTTFSGEHLLTCSFYRLHQDSNQARMEMSVSNSHANLLALLRK